MAPGGGDPSHKGQLSIEIPREEGRPFGEASGTDLAGLTLRSLLVASREEGSAEKVRRG